MVVRLFAGAGDRGIIQHAESGEVIDGVPIQITRRRWKPWHTPKCECRRLMKPLRRMGRERAMKTVQRLLIFGCIDAGGWMVPENVCEIWHYTEYTLSRYLLTIATLLLTACGGGSSLFSFPADAGPWKLKQTKEIVAPDTIRRLGIKRAQAAEYEGPGRLTAELYEMTSSAGALEVEQTWRPSADTVAFHRENLFFVIHWENADRAAVSTFVKQIGK